MFACVPICVSVRPCVHVSFRSSIIAVLQCPTQKGYYHYDDTDVCLKLYTDLRTWYDALLFCQLDGGHLFDFNTEQEFDNFEDYLLNVIGKHVS